jgi:hypothetical protein
MSHRRPDPRQAGLENVLRNALRLAADSVDPAADGLDRIRAKISSRQSAKPSWATSSPNGFLGSLWRWLEPVIVWLRYMAGVVAERFRPDPNLAGRLGWLRPAAAVATGLFVVAAASVAITALPAVITPAGNPGGLPNGGISSSAPASSHSSSTQSNSGPGAGTQSPSSSASHSCRPASAKASSSGLPSPSKSSSSSASPSPSTSPSGSPSPSPSPSTSTPTPTGSPTTSAPTNSPAASAARAGSRTTSPQAAPSSRTRHGSRSGCR